MIHIMIVQVGKISGAAAGLQKGYQDPEASERVRAAGQSVPVLAACLETSSQSGVLYAGSGIAAPVQVCSLRYVITS
jgi:hypothetical protein